MLVSELKDPRLGFVTVTRVELAHDLRYARVYVGVLGSEAEREKSLTALRSAAGFVRRRARPAAPHPPLAGDRLPLRQGARRHRPGGAPSPGGRGAREAARHRRRRGKRGVAGRGRRPGRGQAGGPHLARHRGPGPSGPRDAPGRPHRHARPVRDRRASRLRRAGDAPRALPRRGARRSTSRRCGWGSRPRPTTRRASRSASHGPSRCEETRPWPRLWRTLVGAFDQVPPAFSAKHVGGRRLYELARRGEAVPRSARPGDGARDRASWPGAATRSSSGCAAPPGPTCGRSPATSASGWGRAGTSRALRRTRSGAFDLGARRARRRPRASGRRRLVPLRALLLDLPAVRVGAEGRVARGHGRELRRRRWSRASRRRRSSA